MAGRYDAARDAAAAVARQYGDSSPLVLLRAALLSADGKVRSMVVLGFGELGYLRCQVVVRRHAASSLRPCCCLNRLCCCCPRLLRQAAEADAALQQYSAANPSSALNPTLMRAQLALEAGGSPAKALEILSSLQVRGLLVSGVGVGEEGQGDRERGQVGVMRPGAAPLRRLRSCHPAGARGIWGCFASVGEWRRGAQGPGNGDNQV